MTGITGLSMWASWMYFRMFGITMIIWKGYFVQPGKMNLEPDVAYVVKVCICMVSFLHCLNAWWAWIISKIIFRFVFKGVAEDTHNKV
jgi:hypothetical protein